MYVNKLWNLAEKLELEITREKLQNFNPKNVYQ